MPSVQDTYSENIGKAYAGMIADLRLCDVVTGLCETEAGIAFGKAVSRGVADKGVVLGGTQFAGVTTRDVTLPASQEDTYAEGQEVGVLRHGTIWLTVGEAVNAGDPVYYNTTAGTWFKSAGAGRTQVTRAQWESSATSGLAKCHFADSVEIS
jgi:hypothetical protein